MLHLVFQHFDRQGFAFSHLTQISAHTCQWIVKLSAWVYIVQWLVKTCHVSWTARTLSLNNYSSGSIGISGCEDMKYSTHAAKMIRGETHGETWCC